MREVCNTRPPTLYKGVFMKKILPLFLILLAVMTTGCSCITNNNLYEIKQNGKIGFINLNGKEVVEAKYENAILNNSQPLIAVKFNGLWGFIDKKGEFTIVPQYKETKGFKDGLAYVKDDNFEYYINYKGETVWKQAIEKKQEKAPAPAKKAVSHVKNDLADSIFEELGL